MALRLVSCRSTRHRPPRPRRRRHLQCDIPVSHFWMQNRASWYYMLAHQAASWGIVVVQYDTPAWPIVSIADEVALLPALLQVSV